MFKRRISAKFARLVAGLFVSVFFCATPAFAGNLSEVQAIYDRLIYDSQNIDDDDFFDDNQWQVIDTSQYVTGVVGNNADQAEHTVCPAYAYCSNECGADGHEDMYWLYHDDGGTVSGLQTELSSVMRAPSQVQHNTWKNTFAQAGRFLCPSNTVGRARSVSGNGYDPGEGCWCWWSKRTGATSGYAQLAPKVNDNVFDPIAYDAAYATRNGWYAPCEEPLGTFNIAFATDSDNSTSPEQWTWRAASPTSTTTDWLNTAILTGGVDTSCSPDAGENRNLYLADIMVGNNSLLKEQGAGNFCFGQSDVRALADSACEKLLTVFAPNGLPYVYSLEGISNGNLERLEMCVDPNCELGSVYDKAELDYSDDDGLEVQCGMAYSSTSDSTPHSECYYVGYNNGVQYKLYPYQLDYLIDIFTTMFDDSNSANWENVYNRYVGSNDITFVLGVTNNADATLSATCGAGGGGGGGGSTTTSYTCAAGKYLPKNSTTCATCPAGNYCPGGTYTSSSSDQGLNACPTGTTSTAGAASADACVSTSAITCTAGQYLPRGATVCDTCPGGYFCTGGTFTKSTEYDQGQIACVPGSYSVAGSSVCTACPGGKTSFTSGQYGVYKFPSDAQDYEGWTKEWKTQCESTCCNAANVATWNDTKWELGADKTTQILTNSCNIASCNAGYWKNTWGDGQRGCASQGIANGNTEIAELWEQGWIKTDMCVVNYANYDFSGMNECGVANNGYCDPIYTITLNDNGGTGGAGTVWQWYSNDSIVDSWHNGASATADAITTVAVPTRTGHTFAGYYTGTTQMVDATGKILTPTTAGDSSVGKNDTWTAKWTANGVACAAGKYLPKNSTTCATCPAGYYCPGGTYTSSSSDQGADACPPDYRADKEAEVSNVDSAAGLVEYGFAPDVTGISTPDECTVDAAYSNAMGSWIERRKFDSVVDLLYNTMVGTYYFESMAGYYLSGVNTKCMSAFGAGPSDGVVYNSIKKCDAGYYCPAVASAYEHNATVCGGTNNPTTLGRTQCKTGYTSTAGATACTPITYKVTLDKQSGTGGTSEYYYQYNTKGTCYYYTSSALSTCTDSSDGQNITVPTRTGYTFGGYWTGKNGTGTMYVDSTGLTKNNLYTAVAGNTTLYAKWTGISYTVKYDANGGTGTTASSSHTYGTAKKLTMNGFSNGAKKFLGWSKTKTATMATYSDGQSVKDLTTTDGDIITLYAIWSDCEPCAPGTGAKCELTVETGYCYYTTECLDGYIDIQNDGEYNPTCTANMITCEPGYYVPAGASACAICTNGNYCPGGEYLVLTEADNGLFPCEPGGACNDEGFKSFTKYNISYDLGTGATNNAQNPVQCGVAWLYNDSAWQLACSSVDKTECARPTDGPVSENPDYCTIAYDDGSQVWVGINAADRDGYSFRCWHNMDAPGNTCTDDSVRMDDYTYYLEKLANKSDDDPQSVYNIRLQAVWDVSEYNITYNLNGGTNPAGAKTSYTIETADYTLPTPTKTGYTFGGWYTNSGLTGNAVTQITKGSTGNKTFWAKWTAVEYSITYNLDGGTNNASNPTKYTVETATITLADPTRTGYTFGGWYSDAAFKTQVTKIAKGSTGAKTFYAKWNAVEYSITYNLDGGTNNASNPTKYTVETATITLAAPTKTGYNFGGWYENSGLTGSAVAKIAKGSTGNKTFWAKWTVKSVTCAAGKYLPANSLSCGDCGAGYACPGGTFEYKNTDQGISQCTGRTKYSAAGASACSTVSAGYYTTGCNTNGNGCTGQSQCTGATYCSGGVQSDCPSGYTANTAAGKTAASQCTISVAAGKYLGTKNGTATTSCAANTYKAAHTVNYGSTSSCGTCPSDYPYSDAGASSSDQCYKNGTSTGTRSDPTLPTGCVAQTTTACTPGTCTYRIYKSGTTTSCTPTNCVNTHKACTSAATDYYLDSGVAKGCSVLNSAYPKSDGGNITSSSCYGTFSKSGTQVNGTTPTNCSAVTAWNACTPGTCNYTKYASGTVKTDCTPTDCTKTVKTVTAKSGYYVNNSTSCSACSGLAGGFYPNSDADNTGGASVCYTNSISGKYVATINATSATNCAAGTYKGAHTVHFGSTSSCDSCIGRTKYSAAGAASCSTVSTGYYTTGCDTSSNKCTGQSQCDGSVYCTGGVQKNCPAAESKWTAGTGKGWSAVTSCFETKAATSVSTYCSAGQLKKNATSATAWGASTISTALTAKPGAVVDGQTCTQCTGTSYSAGGTATLCTACPNGYNANESDGKTAASQCQIKCAAKTTVSTANGACTALTTGGYYKGQHLVNYGSTSSAEQCPAGYRDGAAGAAITDCAKSVAGGNYVRVANDADATQCAENTYKTAHTVKYGNTSSCVTCATGYHSAAGATSCTANTYTIAYNAGGGTGVTANTACTYGQNCTLTANGFTNGTKEFKGWATSAGATAAAYGNKASVKNLSDENGATVTLYAVWAECTACDATNANCTLTAPLGVCTYTTSCKTGYGNIQNNGKYNASCSGNSITCDAGEYLPAGATSCKKCEANNYCPGGIFTYTGASQGRNACPSDYPYSDAGASSSDQCYKNGTSTGTRSDPTLPTGCVAQTTTACTPGTCTYRIYKSGTTTSCTPTNCVNTHKACTSAATDYYLDSGVAKGCSVLNSAYPKSDGGNITSSSCYGTFSKSGTQVNGTTPTNCSAVTAWNACTPGTCNYTKYASGTVKTDCTPTDCTKTVKTVTAKSGYYVNNSTSCSACSGLAGGFYPNSDADNTGGASVCYTNSISGKYVAAANATSATECAAGSYKAAHTVNYGDTSSCALCATGYESATGASSCSAIIYTITYELNGGAASTGNPATYTIETATITLAAPTKTGYTFGGWYADAAFKTPVPQIAHGSTGNKTLYAKWSGNTYTVTLNANGGTGGTASVTATYNEQMPTLASVATMADFALVGYFDATTGGTKYYNADGTGAHVWDKTSDATLYAQWLSDFISVKCDAGKYIATGATVCSATCVAGNYCPGGTFTIPRTGATIDTGINGCTGRTKYSAAGAASCGTVSVGYYTTGCAGNNNCTGQSQCTGATYCSGGIKYDCPTAYTANIDAGKTANTQCQIKTTAGNYVSTAQSDQTTCTAGAYCPGDVLVNWGGIGGRTLCTAGTYNPNTGSSLATACVKSDAGYYVDTNGATAQTACTGATYTDAAGATKCTTCPTATKYADALARYSYYNTGAIGDHTTKTKCQAIFNSRIDHGTLVNDACYLGSDNDYGTSTSNGASTCWLLKDGLSCDGGYYNKSQSASTRATVLSNACIAVGAGYWSATGELTRTQCGSGLTTIGYGAGADEAGDCGRILSYGNKTVYLRSVRKTTPSLNVWMDGRTYYGNAAAGNVSGRIRVRRGDTTYSVYDDSMQ
mgnify:CR=1 FL=1